MRVKKWQIIGASTVGSGHIRNGLPCQDAYAYENLGEIVVVAVADGLGSARRSGEGASLSAQQAINYLKDIEDGLPENTEVWIDALSKTFLSVREALEHKAKEDNQALKDFATTLILSVITDEWLAIGHIGDGAVVMLDSNNKVRMASPPQESEYVNEVVPLTADDALEQTRYYVYKENIKAVALLTDGLQHLSVSTKTGEPHERFFRPFFDAMTGGIVDVGEVNKSLAKFLTSERVSMKSDDDKTLVVVGKIKL